MKKLILLYLVTSNLLVAQYNKKDIYDRISLKPIVKLSDTLQVKVYVQSILERYGRGFRYYEELRRGSYKFDIGDAKTGMCYIVIFDDGKEVHRIGIKRSRTVEDAYDLAVDWKEIEKLIDESKIASLNGIRNMPQSIIERNGILHDELILPIDDLDPDEQRLLDRQFMWDNFKDQNGDHSVLFEICQAGCLIPYSGRHS